MDLARPDGNITGINVDVGAELYGKRLQFLRETVGNLTNVRLLGSVTKDSAAFADGNAMIAISDVSSGAPGQSQPTYDARPTIFTNLGVTAK